VTDVRGRSALAWVLAIVAIVMVAIGAVFAVASRHVPLPGQSFEPRGFATVLAIELAIRLSQTKGDLGFEVADDGRGFDQGATGYGTGLQGMADRLAALGGSIDVRSAPGVGTTVAGTLPVGAGP